VSVFGEQVELYRQMLKKAPPTPSQASNVDYLFAGGALFTNIAYAQLILEGARIYGIHEDIVNEIFNFMVRDTSTAALQMMINQENTPEQEAFLAQMLKKPVIHREQSERLYQEFVFSLKDQYVMAE
jgi:acyl-CoA dehydrogenase